MQSEILEYNKKHLAGLPKSFKLISEECLFLSGDFPGIELKQVLSVHANGRVYWNRYYINDTNNGSFPYDEEHRLERNRFNIGPEKAEKILARIAEYFSKADSMEPACDAGTWDIDIECNDGKHVFVAAAMDSEGQLAVISYEIRCILEQDEVWAFDGAYGRKPGDIVVCDVEFPGSKCCYCYKSGELPVKYNDKVMVPTGPMDAETAGVVKDIHYVNPTGENEPFGKLKGIIRILN